MEHNIKHIGIILDGNRSWAVAKGLPKFMGHSEAIKTFKRIIKAVSEKGIPYLTAWALSTENLQRSEEELKHLFSLFENIPQSLGDFKKNNIRVNVLGDLTRIPTKTQKILTDLEKETENNSGLNLNLAIAYGGRDEIVRATKKIIEAGLQPGEITENTFEEFLDTAGIPEVDLVIRTGGHQRLSGYLPWQCTYAELYFTNTRFPDFNEEELDKAIEWFIKQERKRGK